MRLKQRPEDFVVREAYRFEPARRGEHYVYLMDKQKLSTMEAVHRLAETHDLPVKDFSFCGLKDKQGRTEQLLAVRGRRVDQQDPDLRLKFLGRSPQALSAENLTANRFVVTVRDLTIDEAERVPASVEEVRARRVVNYFDSQRFGGVKHGQGFLAKDLARGRVEHALRGYLGKPSPLDKSPDAQVKGFWAKNWGQWGARCPYPAARRYEPVIRHLKRHPKDFAGAFARVEKRARGLMVFEYQSYLWNESVQRYLRGRLGARGHLELRYQAGTLLFPRTLEDPVRYEALMRLAFPLVGPDSTFEDPEIEKAVVDTMARERLTLESLGFPDVPAMGMRHELRPLMVEPRRLTVVDPRPDELNPGRIKVTLAFTLPPGAYATLVVRRTMWLALGEDVVARGGELPEAEPGFIPSRLRDELHRRASRAVHRRNRRPRPSRGIAVEDVVKKKSRPRPARKK